MPSINMLSCADKFKGQGVGSAYLEQVELVKSGMSSDYNIIINKLKLSDIMHYHTIDFKHYLSLPFSRLKGVNVGSVHFLPETIEGSIKLPLFAKNIFYWYIISFYKKMDYLVTCNSYFINKLAEHGIQKEKVAYIPNFVSSKEFFPLEENEKKLLRQKYGIKQDEFVVLDVGQVQTRKGVLDFIQVAEKLKDVKFLWAGGFTFGKITAGYTELKKVMENPPPNVKFLGIVEREQMNEIYNISNILFMPSYQELFPMIILEAFNCKLPILLRDLDIYPDVFFDYYIKGSNNDEFINEIIKLKNDSQCYNYSCEQSWKGHKFYSAENVLSMWKEFYNKAMRKETISEEKYI
jgi:1,2-diacylglycerol-3-alpha-glucose alpha-1,2-galactosyltransferase